MTPEQNLQQLLGDWNRTLPIDGLSGESIVTLADLDRLRQELDCLLHDRGGACSPVRRLSRSFATSVSLLLKRRTRTALPGKP